LNDRERELTENARTVERRWTALDERTRELERYEERLSTRERMLETAEEGVRRLRTELVSTREPEPEATEAA
jgi:hypothetical protein